MSVEDFTHFQRNFERTLFVFDSNVHICLLFSTFHLSSILLEYVNFNVAKVLDLYYLLINTFDMKEEKRNEIPLLLVILLRNKNFWS